MGDLRRRCVEDRRVRRERRRQARSTPHLRERRARPHRERTGRERQLHETRRGEVTRQGDPRSHKKGRTRQSEPGPSSRSTSGSYQLMRSPKRTTRGATTELIWFAVVAFCWRCSAWMVLKFPRLNTSSDGTMWRPPIETGRSTWKSTFWKFGSRFVPT